MGSTVQKPESTHKKSTSIVRTIQIGEPHSMRPAGRRQERKFGGDLVQRRSDDANDPLNWPRWRKETAFGSLCLSMATIGVLKTLYVTTNSVIATQYNSSYMAAAAFTGIPFIMAGLSSLGSTMLSQFIGKRIIYLVSGLMMLIGVLWNMHVMTSYSWFMVSRMMQGIGWGASEGLLLISIRDMFFIHERGFRTHILRIVSLTFTWGSPIPGGYISQSTDTFRNQLMVLNIIQAVAVASLILFVPETSFNRSSSSETTLTVNSNFGTVTTVSAPSSLPFRSYLSTLHPLKYTTPFSLSTALQPIRALSAPTTLLTFLLTAPLVATAYGVANSLSLLFAAMPTFLFPTRIGYIFIIPVALVFITYTLMSIISYFRNQSATSKPDHLTAAIPGVLLGISGLLSFGLYIAGELSPKKVGDGTATVFSLDTTGIDLSLETVSLLFGILLAGSTLVSFAASAHLSSPSSGSNNPETHIQSAHGILQDVFTGIFIIGFPSWVQGSEGMMEGLKNTVIAISVLQIILASTVGAVLVVKGEGVTAVDRRVLGVREEREAREGTGLQRWKTGGSFSEA